MSQSTERMIADAKRAARRLARTRAETYQECLDIIAKEAGRAHWGAFLADPVDVRARPEASDDEIFVVRDPKPSLDEMDLNGLRFLPQRPEADRFMIADGAGAVLGIDRETGRTLRGARRSTTICVGSPGTGKTMGVVMPTIVSSPDASMLIQDVKPELLAAMIALGARTTTRIVILDPLGTGRSGSERIAFNPLHPSSRAGDEDAADQAARVASILIPPGSHGDSYFSDKARDLIADIALHLAMHPDEIPDDGRGRARVVSIPAILDWMISIHSGDLAGQLKAAAALHKSGRSGNPSSMRVGRTFASLADMHDKERAGILGTADWGLLTSKNREVRTFLDPIDPADGAALFVALSDPDKATTAFMTSDNAMLAAITPLHALILDGVGRWRAAQGPSARSLQVVLDESMKIGRVPWVDEVLKDGAPNGTSLLIVTQTLKRIDGRVPFTHLGLDSIKVDRVVSMVSNNPDADAHADVLLGRRTTIRTIDLPPGTHVMRDAASDVLVTTPMTFPPRSK